MRITIFIILTSLFVVSGNAATFCSQEPDQFVVKCSIPDKYFIQDFTCFDRDCFTIATNNGSFLELTFPQTTQKSIILPNNINLKELYGNTEILKQLCEEQITDRAIAKLNDKIRGLTNSESRTFSGERLVIEPVTEESTKIFETKKQTISNNLFRCYETNVEKLDGWYFETREKREYCQLTYNNEGTCVETKIDPAGFAGYVITNPNQNTLPYLLTGILLILFITGSLFLSHRLMQRQELKEFFKITSNKIIINSVIVVPLIYMYGIGVEFLISNNDYLSDTYFIELLFLLVGIVLIYYLSCAVEYTRKNIIKKKTKKKP